MTLSAANPEISFGLNGSFFCCASLLVAFATTVACGPASTSTNDGVGGSPGGSGGSNTIALAPEMDIVTPVGPGETAGPVCPEVVCNGSSYDKEWTLAQRCDQAGTWADPECPEASFAWTLTSASGTFIHQTEIAWNLSTTTQWTISFPASCGGCEVLDAGRLSGPFASFSETLTSSWQALSCAPDASGACACTGTLVRQESYEGQAVGDADDQGNTAGRYLIEEHASLKTAKYLAVEHRIGLCAGQTELVVYDENGGHYYFTAP